MGFTPWLRVLGGLLAARASASTSTLLTMTKVGGYESLSEDPLEIVVVKPSTNVSYYASVFVRSLHLLSIRTTGVLQ